MKKFVYIFLLCAILLPMQVVMAKAPTSGPGYVIVIDEGNIIIDGYNVTLSGTASADPFTGQDDQQFITIEWEPGVETVIVVEPPEFTFSGPTNNGSFTGTWTASHTYASSGEKTATAKVHHQNAAGAEGSDWATYEVGVTVPPTGSITVNKVVDNGDEGTAVVEDFQLYVSGTPVTSGAVENFTPGNYVVTEDNQSGYVGTFSGDCDSSGNIELGDGDELVCTLTNTFQGVTPTQGILTVMKEVEGSENAAESFNLSVSGLGETYNFTGSAAGEELILDAGAYTVSEDEYENFTPEFTGDCDEEGAVTLEPGDEKVCTVTNVYQEPTEDPAYLAVTKIVVGGDAVVEDFNLYVDQLEVVSGAQNEFIAGTYQVSEVGPDDNGYIGSFDETSDCDASGSVTLEPGDEKECVLINTYYDEKPTQGTILVIKEVINDNGGFSLPSDFTMLVDAINASEESFAGDSNGTVITVDPGEYSVDEEVDSRYAKTLSGACSGTIEAGQTVICTITNDDIAPKLTVTKVVSGGSKLVEDFPLYVCPVYDEAYAKTAVNLGFAYAIIPTEETEEGDVNYAPCDGLVHSGEENEYNPGDFIISEINEFESTYTASFSGDCDEEGNISLELGDEKSCVITNRYTGGGGSSGGGSSGGGSAGGSAIERNPSGDSTPTANPEPSEPNEPVDTPEITPVDDSEGEVLSEEACGMYLYEYIHIRKENNPEEVVKLQLFLNEYMNENLEVNGMYDVLTFKAVRNFQLQEFKEVLEPWGINDPTGYVYITTRRKINMIKCPELNIPIPEWLVPDTNIFDNE